jgi:hypothetical protein
MATWRSEHTRECRAGDISATYQKQVVVHEDRVRRVRAGGGDGAVLRRRGRALRPLRRRGALRQQARRQAPPRRPAAAVRSRRRR